MLFQLRGKFRGFSRFPPKRFYSIDYLSSFFLFHKRHFCSTFLFHFVANNSDTKKSLQKWSSFQMTIQQCLYIIGFQFKLTIPWLELQTSGARIAEALPNILVPLPFMILHYSDISCSNFKCPWLGSNFSWNLRNCHHDFYSI